MNKFIETGEICKEGGQSGAASYTHVLRAPYFETRPSVRIITFILACGQAERAFPES